jgi:hypothetical protein
MDLAQGADAMSTKPTGLRKNALASQVISTTDIPERQRGKKEIVPLTVRLQRAEWERLHQLAVSEGMSIQALAVRGLNRVFTEKGLPQLMEE